MKNPKNKERGVSRGVMYIAKEPNKIPGFVINACLNQIRLHKTNLSDVTFTCVPAAEPDFFILWWSLNDE